MRGEDLEFAKTLIGKNYVEGGGDWVERKGKIVDIKRVNNGACEYHVFFCIPHNTVPICCIDRVENDTVFYVRKLYESATYSFKKSSQTIIQSLRVLSNNCSQFIFARWIQLRNIFKIKVAATDAVSPYLKRFTVVVSTLPNCRLLPIDPLRRRGRKEN